MGSCHRPFAGRVGGDRGCQLWRFLGGLYRSAVRSSSLAAPDHGTGSTAGRGPLRDGMDSPVVWSPSRWDRKSHPHLSADACIRGRLIVRRVQPDNGATPFLLYLFTTLATTADEALNLYGKRWSIETDLRTLKTTLRLDQLTCCTSDMVAKEIAMGIASYNLVRAVTCLASEQSGIPPRGYSFTTVRRIVEVFTPKLAA